MNLFMKVLCIHHCIGYIEEREDFFCFDDK